MFSKNPLIWLSSLSHKLCVMHFMDLLLHPFFESFLQFSVLISSFTAKKMLESLISDAGLSNVYPPCEPLKLFTNFFLSVLKIVALSKLAKYFVS